MAHKREREKSNVIHELLAEYTASSSSSSAPSASASQFRVSQQYEETSSTEEETRHKLSSKRQKPNSAPSSSSSHKQQKKSTRSASGAISPPQNLRTVATLQPVVARRDLPVMESIDKLLFDNEYMQQNSKGEDVCDLVKRKKSKKKDSRTARTTNDKQLEQLSVFSTIESDEQSIERTAAHARSLVPWFDALFRSKLEAISEPTFVQNSASTGADSSSSTPSLTVDKVHEQLTQELLQDTLTLQVMTSDLESQLLAESGRWKMPSNGKIYDFPPCPNDQKCRCMLSRVVDQPRGFVGTALMYDFEYSIFLKTNTPPRARRPCIMCCRFILMDYLLLVRSLKAKASEAILSEEEEAKEPDMPLQLPEEEKTQVYQLFQNLVDKPGGYRREFLLFPEPNEPLVEPIVTPNRSFLVCRPMPGTAVKEGKGCRLRMDQDSIVWKADSVTVPRVGENLQRF